jgi:hypothetical protein
MGSKFIVQIEEDEAWQAVYKGDDPEEAQRQYHEAKSKAGEDKVRCIKAVGTKEDGRTKWALVRVPDEPINLQKGLYGALVDRLHGFWVKRGHNVARWEIKYIYMPLYILFLGGGGLLACIALIMSGNGETPNAVSASSVEVVEAIPAPVYTIPKVQLRFNQILEQYRAQYKQAQNDIQRRLVREKRQAAIQQLFANTHEVSNWSATLKTLYTSSDGTVDYFKLSAGPHLTFNHGEDIQKADRRYNQLARISEGAAVVFSGRLTPNRDDHFFELSLTEYGGMNDPEFRIEITDISLENEWQPSARASDTVAISVPEKRPTAQAPAASPSAEVLKYPHRVQQIGLGATKAPCTPAAETYVDVLRKPVLVQMECSFGPSKDRTTVVFSADGKTVIKVERKQYLTGADPEIGTILSAAIQFYGQPRTYDDGNWLAVYGNAHSARYDGRRIIGIDENESGMGMMIRGMICGNGRGGSADCGGLGTKVITYELVDGAAVKQADVDGRALIARQLQERAANQQF